MTRVARASRNTLAVLALAALPAAAYAQGAASITGVVRDVSGAVLPGVTVEASSPVLIEKVRTVVSDGGGQYRIVDLRPGVYSVTFSLEGFSTYKRDGIELSGNFIATINAEMKVGAREETITVTAAAPTVDVQGVTRQRVLSNDTIEAVPTGRNYTNLGVLVPGVTTQCAQTCGTGSQDVGGASGDSRDTLTVHGSRFRDQRIAINGMTIEGSTGGLTMSGPNMEAMQEVQIETSGIDASVATGGVRINVVPKDGGNIFSGSLFATGTNQNFQGNNFTPALQAAGLAAGARPRIKSVYDVAPTFGGPIVHDKLWFFLSGRIESNRTYVGNLFANANAYDQTKWLYVADTTKQTTHDSPLHPVGARLTWQATPRNKFAASVDLRERCDCPNTIGGTSSLEATTDFIFRPDNVDMFTWSSPVTNRLLLEGTFVALPLGWGNRINSGINPNFLQVTLQNAPAGVPATYRGGSEYNWTNYPFWNVAFNTTYVTGAHAFKVGVNDDWGYAHTHWTVNSPISSIRINAANGLPNQFTVNSDPREGWVRTDYSGGAFVQDKWTLSRLTLSGGLRFDAISETAPSVTEGPAPLLPNRNVVFPTTNFKKFTDLSPRLGAAVDLFGNGKTALKVTLNRYVTDDSLGSGTNNIIGSPQIYFQYTASRTWTDANGNFYPDCDLASGVQQDLRSTGGDFCGAFTGTSANFGLPAPGTVADPSAVRGFGNRGHNWEFSTSVQQELVKNRVALDVGFFRRWYGGFTVQDNLAIATTDYTAFSVVVPTDPALPLSGQTISGFLDPNPNVSSLPTNNHVTAANQYGTMYENWQGVDVNLSARLGGGTLVQGGFSSGRQATDNCAVLAKVPEGGVTTQNGVGSSRVDLQACKLEYSIVSPK